MTPSARRVVGLFLIVIGLVGVSSFRSTMVDYIFIIFFLLLILWGLLMVFQGMPFWNRNEREADKMVRRRRKR